MTASITPTNCNLLLRLCRNSDELCGGLFGFPRGRTPDVPITSAHANYGDVYPTIVTMCTRTAAPLRTAFTTTAGAVIYYCG